jgi:hypothetical protein
VNIKSLSTLGLLLSFGACLATDDGVDDGANDGADNSADRARPVRGVDLGTAGNFVIVAKSGVSTVPPAAIVGNIAVSPIAAGAITGFALRADRTNTFSTSSQVVGRIYAADYASPTPATLTVAVHDMERAFTDAAGRAPNVVELGAGNLGGMTLSPGVYKWGTSVLVPTNITLSGSATDVWIFEIAQNLTFASGARVVMAGGARPEHVFWQVSQGVSLGSTAHLEGIVLAKTAITLNASASVKGKLLAQTAVTLIANKIVDATP